MTDKKLLFFGEDDILSTIICDHSKKIGIEKIKSANIIFEKINCGLVLDSNNFLYSVDKSNCIQEMWSYSAVKKILGNNFFIDEKNTLYRIIGGRQIINIGVDDSDNIRKKTIQELDYYSVLYITKDNKLKYNEPKFDLAIEIDDNVTNFTIINSYSQHNNVVYIYYIKNHKLMRIPTRYLLEDNPASYSCEDMSINKLEGTCDFILSFLVDYSNSILYNLENYYLPEQHNSNINFSSYGIKKILDIIEIQFNNYLLTNDGFLYYINEGKLIFLYDNITSIFKSLDKGFALTNNNSLFDILTGNIVSNYVSFSVEKGNVKNARKI